MMNSGFKILRREYILAEKSSSSQRPSSEREAEALRKMSKRRKSLPEKNEEEGEKTGKKVETGVK